MKISTLAALCVFGMLSTSAAAFWMTAETPVAQAATARSPALPAPADGPASHLNLPGRLELDARVGHELLDAKGDGETYLLFSARAPKQASSRPPMHVALVIDRSGSMRGQRLDNALAAARGMVQRLVDGDVVSVMTYDTQVSTLVTSTRIDETSRARVLGQLNSVSAKGNTCISCGLESALAVLEGSSLVKQILLLSDGEPTSGVLSSSGFQQLTARARRSGIGVSSIGLDVDYNEALLSLLARQSNGRHHFVRKAGDLERAFDSELSALSGSVATDAVLDVELPPGVEVLQVFDREVERSGRHVRARLGTFATSDEKTLFMKVRVPAGAALDLTLANFSLQYRSVENGEAASSEAKGALGVRLEDLSGKAPELDPLVAARIGRARTGALLLEAGGLFASGEAEDFSELDRRLNAEIQRAKKDEKTASAGGTGTKGDFNAQWQALDNARNRLRTTRAARCGCAASDLMCAMRCGGGATKPRSGACKPGDPLCGEVGDDLSDEEKAAAKESVGASDPFAQ